MRERRRSGLDRVVVTGVGLVCPLGIGAHESWAAAEEGRSAETPLGDLHGMRGAGPVCRVPDFRATDFMERRLARRTQRFSQLAIAASRLALADAGLPEFGERWGIGALIGTMIGGIEGLEMQAALAHERGADRISPLAIPMICNNMAVAQVSIVLGLKGPVSCVVGESSGLQAVAAATHALQLGRADAMLAGGAEAPITPLVLAGLDAMGVLSRQDGEAAACRPFDIARDGTVIGEAGAVLVLERLRVARERGARVLCEVLGAAGRASADGRPSATATSAALEDALAAGGTEPVRLDYVNVHGAGDRAGDVADVEAVAAGVEPAWGQGPAVSATKSMHGHCLGAAGALEAALTVGAITRERIPPTINLRQLDPACDGVDHVAGRAREGEIAAAATTSFGIGGHHSAVVLGADP